MHTESPGVGLGARIFLSSLAGRKQDPSLDPNDMQGTALSCDTIVKAVPIYRALIAYCALSLGASLLGLSSQLSCVLPMFSGNHFPSVILRYLICKMAIIIVPISQDDFNRACNVFL